jgi:hypothetical protein
MERNNGCAVPQITFVALIAIVVLFVPLAALAGSKSKGQVTPEIHPDMLVEIPGLEVEKVQKPCDNWAWWAAVQSVFEQQNLPLSQSFFVDRSDGGACWNNDDHPLNLYDVASAATGDYALPNGRRFHSEVSLGPTAVPAPMIVKALRAGRPLVMVWQKRPYVVQGILFDDKVFPGGQHSFFAKEVHLIDPTDGKPVKLTLDEQNVGEVVGVMDVVITQTK